MLTKRQVECLSLVARGMSSREIGIKLGLSSRTVESYLLSAARRLKVRGRILAFQAAQRQGFI